MAEEEYIKKRNYVRVEDKVPIFFKILSKDIASAVFKCITLSKRDVNKLEEYIERLRKIKEEIDLIIFEIEGILKEKWEEGVGITKDISGGGVRFLSDTKINPGSIIEIKLELPMYPYCISAEAEVLEAKLIKDQDGKEKFEHRVKFINIDEDEREDLIKYLFERQRIYLKERKK